MKKKISIIAILLITAFFTLGCNPKPKTDIVVTVGDGVNLTVGIISDTQLAHTPTYDYQYQLHLLYALETLKARGAEAIIFAGDFGNLLSDYMYDTFNYIYDYVFKDDAPEKIFVMGNHDYWYENNYNTLNAKKQRLFEKHTGESPWSHKVINGYHFIALSPTTSNSYAKKRDWFEKEYAIAAADGDKPIFVVTHHNPRNTVYGSEETDLHEGWGLSELDDMFKGKERLVSFSGHSHYSLVDERSIYQDTYTAIQTQALAYIELEYGKENGSIPPDAEKNPMMMLMKISGESAEIERISVKTGETEGENWVLPLSLSSDKFTYTKDRANAAVAPSMVTDGLTNGKIALSTEDSDEKFKKKEKRKEVTYTETVKRNFLTFDAGKGAPGSFVHSYKVQLIKDGVTAYEYLYFSDFYNGRNNMSETVKLKLNPEITSGEYTVRIYAVESYGKTSANYLESVVNINKPVK